MKKLLCFAISTAALTAGAFVPEVGYQPNWVSVDSIDCSPEATRLSITLSNYPGYWVKVDGGSVLTDEATGKTYKIISQENLPLSQEIWMPESGRHSGTLIFEPLTAGVKSLSFTEPGGKTESGVYGIRLDKPRNNATEQRGESMADVLARTAPAEKWDGFDASKYSQMEFYKPGSKAVLRGQIGNVYPGYSTVLRTNNYINRDDQNTLVEFDAEGNFSVEVPIDYPQRAGMRLGRAYVNVFLAPGDTVELYSTTRGKLDPDMGTYEPLYLRVSGTNPDAAAISCLTKDVRNRFVSHKADYQWWIKKVQAGLDSINDAAASIKADMPGIITSAQAGIAEYPISPFAKDFLFTYAVLENYMALPDMALYYEDNQYKRVEDENGRPVMTPNPDYVAINPIDYYGGQQAYQDLIYDNPLALCVDYLIINRSQFSPLFRWQDLAIDGLKTLPDFGQDLNELKYDFGPAYPLIKRYEQQRQQAIGLGDCYMQQAVLATAICSALSTRADLTEESLERNAQLLGELMPLFTCRPLAAEVIAAYGNLAQKYGMKIGGAGNARVVDVESDVIAALVEPYAGRVVYIDVWDITCGPCRAGIMGQKPLLQQYADQPFTVIYLAPEASKDKCEAWLTENGIQGEHVYLSEQSYNRLAADFNIAGIPYGILIDKQGRVRDQKIHTPTSDLIDPLLNE